MADKTIGSLPSVESVNDDSLIPAEQQGQAVKVTGAQFKQFAQASVSQYVSEAQTYATQAAQSAAEAAESVTQIGDAVSQTQANKEAAQTAQTAAESARDEAIEASHGVSAHVTQAQQAASQAAQSASDAQTSASTAETYSDSAEIAKTAAETAKSSAETARDSAEAASAAAAGYSSTAQTSASQASQSAQTAQFAQSAAETAKTGAESARQAIENMMVEAITLATGQPATVSKSLVDQVVKLTFGLPAGAKGDPGNKGDTGTGIQSIELTSGTHAPGTTDTYTITLTDGSAFNFYVYNGADGQGVGDMLKSTYDPQNRNTDIFAYVDDAVSGVTITTDAMPTQGSTNPIQSGGVYTALSQKQDTITGQQGQVVGFDAEGKPVAQAAPDTGVISFNGRKGEVSPSADDYSASMIKFTDGQTFQQKYDAGQLTGPAGANGSNGQDGSPGADGEDGGYYQPAVDGSGNLTWTASKSGMPAVSGANIKGATGPAGTNGKDATINGQNVLNLLEGTNISFNQSGSNLTINAGGGGIPVVATEGTGAAYTATVPGITEISDGLLLVLTFHKTSTTTTPTLNVNGLGAYKIRRLDVYGMVVYDGPQNDWLRANTTSIVMYRSGVWINLNSYYVSNFDVDILTSNDTGLMLRGIKLQTSTPSSVKNGSIVGVYTA